MKPNIHCVVLAFLLSLFFSKRIEAQTFGTNASAVWITNCEQSEFFNTTGDPSHLIGPSANAFTNANLGAYAQNSGSLILRGGEVKTFKTPGVANVCSVRMYYRVYLQSGVPGAFNIITLPLFDNCDVPSSQFPSGGSCVDGDQKWHRVIADGETIPYSPVDLTTFPPGTYTLEVYYDVTGSFTSTILCNDIVTLNNGGANYKASFFIQSPAILSTNPTTCNGSEGHILFSGLAAGAIYDISYTDGATQVGPVSVTANGSGQASITGLNAGIYSNFSLVTNGCETNLFTGIILSNPVFTPTFNAIAPFCAGTVPPVLPTVSKNGITGTWNPSTIGNQNSGAYTFTPDAGQCALPTTINVTVRPITKPVFSFGTSLSICAGGAVPILPGTSLNGINGVWNPAVVSNQNSDTYTFTPISGAICPVAATFTVTVNPNITPTFSFGTSLSICAGDAAPALPATSDNGITGTWSSSSIDNQNSATYTFTPDAGQCATTASLSVTVNPIVTPTFSIGTSLTVCENGTVPSLPAVSDNGINGTWNPAVIDNQNSGTYTFTPASGQCAIPATYTVTITQEVTPTFSFGTSLSICAGAPVPSLPGSSNNGITGLWIPSVIDDQNSGTYIFIPSVGQCATTATLNVAVSPIITPTFSFGTALSFCAGATAPALPIISTNGINGSWSPAVINNQNSGTYTFTPAVGQCAVPINLIVTVNPIVTPTFAFGSSLTICASGPIPVLPATSDNGINGSWNPSLVDDQNSGTYTFTPAAGECAVAASFTVTVNPNITPTFSFGASVTICQNAAAASLPATSTNGITGTWNPAVIDNQNSGTYTFTPDAGQCALVTTLSVTVNPNITPTFSFGTSLSICAGSTGPVLSTTSDNGINGTWSPSVIDNQNSGGYLFTPTVGQCATTTTLTVTIDPIITPTFSFGSSLTICAGGSVPILPVTSANGVTGVWNPAVADNQASGVYTFTPAAGQCAATATFSVTVNPNITPTFAFGISLSICDNAIAPTLPTTSDNGITGTWSPSVIDNQNSGNYIFTPDAGLCAVPTNLAVTVNPIVTPTFSIGTTLTICAGATVPALPTTSDNGITGTWSPSAIDNQNSGTYTFAPSAGQCATTATFTVTVTPNMIPTFSFGNSLSICTGGSVPPLPATSDNGIAGTWNPAVVSDQASGVYTFTPSGGVCALAVTFTVTVNPILTPAFDFGTTQSICIGATVPSLVATSTNGVKGSWSPAAIDNMVSAAYTFTPDPGECANKATLTVTVNPIPSVIVRTDTTVYDGDAIPATDFIETPSAVINWTNSNPAIGLPASGTGNVPTFKATNMGNDPITGTITVTPSIGGCIGAAKTYGITVKPLNKDVFVPNVFSPNGDGKNDILYVYGNYINTLEMRVFNQWGEQVALISNRGQGWNGTQRGKPQPVGVYVYVLKAGLTDGRTVNLKGSITLVR